MVTLEYHLNCFIGSDDGGETFIEAEVEEQEGFEVCIIIPWLKLNIFINIVLFCSILVVLFYLDHLWSPVDVILLEVIGYSLVKLTPVCCSEEVVTIAELLVRALSLLLLVVILSVLL